MISGGHSGQGVTGDQMILRLEDGTVSGVLSVEWCGDDTETQEQAADNKYWVDVWCDNREIIRYCDYNTGCPKI